MQYGINKLKSGAGSLVEAMLGGSGGYDKAYADTFKDLQAGQFSADRARKARAEAGISEDQLSALQGLDGTLGPLMVAQGLDAQLGPSLAGLMRAGGGNAANLADALRTTAGGSREQGAVSEFADGNPDLANIMLRAAGRTPYTPYSQSASGSVLHGATGAVDQSNPLARSAIDENRAQAASGYASAGASRARERLLGVQGQTEALRPDLVRAQTSAADALALDRLTGLAAGPGGDKPTTASRKEQELIAGGMDPRLARGIAYGTFKVLGDPLGMSKQIVDLASQQVIATMDAKGNITWTTPSGLAPSDITGQPSGPAPAGNDSDPLKLRGGAMGIRG
jgi:hypothetical protein